MNINKLIEISIITIIIVFIISIVLLVYYIIEKKHHKKYPYKSTKMENTAEYIRKVNFETRVEWKGVI